MAQNEYTMDASAALDEFLAAGEDGSLAGMPVEYVTGIADRIGRDTSVLGFGNMPPEFASDELLYTYFTAQAHSDLESTRAREAQAASDYERNAMDIMFMHAGVTPEQAGRMMYDAANGDHSALLGVREKFYYG